MADPVFFKKWATHVCMDACFRYMCRKVCWFESGSGHKKPSQNTVKAFLYPAFFAAYLNAFTPPFPATPIKKDAPPLPRSAFL